MEMAAAVSAGELTAASRTHLEACEMSLKMNYEHLIVEYKKRTEEEVKRDTIGTVEFGRGAK